MSAAAVSVTIPCFGQRRFVHEAIGSIQRQSYPHWSATIVHAAEDADAIASMIAGDNRFASLCVPRLSLAAARNVGIRNGVGEYVVTLDADDLLAPTYFTRAVEVLERDPSVKVLYSRILMFGDETGEPQLPAFTLEGLRRRNLLNSAAMFRRADYRRVGGFDEALSLALEDWEFWIAILKDGGGVVRLPSVEFYYRRHAGSMSTNWSAHEWLEAREYILRKHPGFCV